MKKHNLLSHGFTLLEIMISLFIFTIVGILISQGLNAMLRTQERLELKNNILLELQLTNMILERDIAQITNRPILNEYGERIPALVISANEMEFTHAGYLNPLQVDLRSSLQRVRYKIENKHLIRYFWKHLDRVMNSKIVRQDLLSHIQQFQLKLISSSSTNRLVGIQVNMDIEGLGTVTRLIPIATNTLFENTHV